MGNAIISRREQRELKKTKENYDFEEKLLPEELKSCTTKYTCFLPNGDVLISGYGEDIGVWHFEKRPFPFINYITKAIGQHFNFWQMATV